MLGASIRYDESDAMNALQIFMHVCNNIAIHGYMDNGTPLEETLPIHEEKGRKLAEVFKELTGIDSRTFYKK